jgi:hypothetical protein
MYETSSLILKDEHRLRVFDSRMLGRVFEPKRDEVIGGWRKLHNEELHDVYSSPSIIKMIKSRRMRWAQYVARMGIRGTPEGKKSLGRKEIHFPKRCVIWFSRIPDDVQSPKNQ